MWPLPFAAIVVVLLCGAAQNGHADAARWRRDDATEDTAELSADRRAERRPRSRVLTEASAAAAGGAASACAPLPLGHKFRWFHVPKTGTSFGATIWRVAGGGGGDGRDDRSGESPAVVVGGATIDLASRRRWW